MRAAVARWAAGLLLLLPATGCLSASLAPFRPLEEALLFLPSPYPEGDWQAADLVHEDVWFTRDDGTLLHGWYCPVQNPRAVVLYCHGNAGNVASLKWQAKLLQEKLGVTVLVFDYCGYGQSRGKPDETGILADARGARRWLALRAGVPEADIVLLGHSLGGAVAVDLATCPARTNLFLDGFGIGAVDPAPVSPRGLILENTFPSLTEVVAANFWPLHCLMSMRLDSAAKIGRYHGPLLQTHGTADGTIPFALGRKLFEAANEPKRFVAVEGGGHNGPPSWEYVQALDEFLASLPPTSKIRE